MFPKLTRRPIIFLELTCIWSSPLRSTTVHRAGSLGSLFCDKKIRIVCFFYYSSSVKLEQPIYSSISTSESMRFAIFHLRSSAASARQACVSERPHGSSIHSCFPNSNALSLTRSTAKLWAVEMILPSCESLIQLRIIFTLYI